MPTFPRGTRAKPRIATPPRFPSGLQSWGDSGKGQARAVQNMGRVWEEVYPVLDTQRATVRALFAALNRAIREGTLWDVQHPYWQVRLGAGGGTPLVWGASQTGNILNVDGATPNVTGWLKTGDLIKVTGAPVLLDVTADVNTNGLGQAAIPIHPPLYVAPADNASVGIDPAVMTFSAIIVSVQGFPGMDSTRYVDAGLTVVFKEQPQ